MSTSPFEIKVVYDATQRKRRGVMVRTSNVGRAASIASLMVLGAVLNLAVAGAMYYATWWKVDPFIYITLLTKTPLEVPREFAANPFGFRSLPATPEPVETTATVKNEEPSESASPWRWSAKTARVVIGASAYVWLTLATIGACVVAMAGGTWLGVVEGRWARTLGALGGVVLLLGVAYMGYKVWVESEGMYKPDQLRVGIGLMTLFMGLLGLALAPRARSITKMAGVLVVLAAAVTAAGMWLWAQNGALDTQYASWSKLGTAFAIHAAWGVVLLVSARRIRA